ncbi:ribonuclease III, partial [Staphylococcus epidermidis]
SALEAVIGFLYLDHQSERLENLLETIVRIVDER